MQENAAAYRAFVEQMKRAQAEKKWSHARLAHELSEVTGRTFSTDLIKRWHRTSSSGRPWLEDLPHISKLLGLDHVRVLETFGLVHPDSSEAHDLLRAYAIQKLEQKHQELLERPQGPRSGGTSAIVAAALTDHGWDIGVSPVIEGPPEVQMHVGDLIAFTPVPVRDVGAHDVWGDESLRPTLRDVAAYPVNDDERQSRWAKGRDPKTSVWALDYTGFPLSACVASPVPGAASVLVYALTRQSWANDVATFVAFTLGYGVTTTLDLATDLTPHQNPGQGSATARLRNDLHRGFLSSPPRRRVWSHHAPPSASRDGVNQRVHYDVLEPTERNVTVVWLKEDDETLARFVEDRHYNQGAFTFDQLCQDRAALERRVAGTDVLVIDVNMTGTRTDRWEAVFRSSHQVMRNLLDDGLLELTPRLRSAWLQRCHQFPRVALPFFTWLTQRDPRIEQWVGEELRTRRSELAARS